MAETVDISNFNQLLYQLEGLSPQQLQQVGMLHHDDLAVMSAISHINSQRQKAAQAMMAQRAMSQPPMPTVAQQVVQQAGSLPENMGIAQVAPNMNIPGGGITGEEEQQETRSAAGGGMMYGDVEHYAPGGSTAAMQAFNAEFREFLRKAGMSVSEYRAATPDAKAALKEMFSSQRGAPLTAYEIGQKAAPYVEKAKAVAKTAAGPLAGAALSGMYGLSEVDRAKEFYEDPNVPTSEKLAQFARTGVKTALPYIGGAVGSGFAPVLGTAAGAGLGMGVSSLIDPEGQALREWQKANANRPDSARAIELDRFRQELIDAQQLGDITKEQAEKIFADTVAKGIKNPSLGRIGPTDTGAATTAGAGAAPSAGGAPGADRSPLPATPAAVQPMSVDELITARNLIKSKLPAEDPAAKERAELGRMMTAGAEEDVKFAEARAAKVAERYKGRDERYAKQEAELAKDAERNTGLALLTAAAAILKPGGFAAGLMNAADKALPQYQEGLNKLKAAQDKINLGREHLEDLRYASEDMTEREIRQAKTLARHAGMDAKKLMIQGIMETQGVRDKEANSIFDNYVKQHVENMQQSGALQRTVTAGQYGVAAAEQRGAMAGDARLISEARKIQADVDNAIKQSSVLKYDAAAAEKFRREEYIRRAQQIPGVAEYLGITGGGGVAVPQGVTVRKVGD